MTAAIWDEWGRITRFLESARLAFAREFESLESVRGDDVKVTNGRSYRVDLVDHLAAIQDFETLHGAVLIHTYALAESAAADQLGVSLRELQGIEEWGGDLLAAAGSSWEQVDGGRAGAVEAAVARNAYAHGVRELDQLAAKRLRRGGAGEHQPGERIELGYKTLQRHRRTLRLLLTAGGIRRAVVEDNGEPQSKPLDSAIPVR